MKELVIGTRGSKLALWQAEWVRTRLSEKRPDIDFRVQVIKTEGDSRHELSPAAFGREGIFTAELDRALLEGRIDLAVHSLKDLPTRINPDLCLAAVTERGPTADFFILRADRAEASSAMTAGEMEEFLASRGAGLVVGTSSLRRIAQLKNRFPALRFTGMRGNLDTRLRKLGEGEVDALVVAEAGMVRLGLDPAPHLCLRLEGWYLPAAGQAALGVVTRKEGRARQVAALIDHAVTRAEVSAERTAMAALGAGCRVPAGFLARIENGGLKLQGMVGSPDGTRVLRAEKQGNGQEPESLGQALARELLKKGAGEILKKVREEEGR